MHCSDDWCVREGDTNSGSGGGDDDPHLQEYVVKSKTDQFSKRNGRKIMILFFSKCFRGGFSPITKQISPLQL